MPRFESQVDGVPRQASASRGSRIGAAARHAAEPAARKTGIRVMGDMPWGSHLCIFYESKADLLDIGACYLKAGLSANELCLWAVSEPITEVEARAALRKAVPDFERRLDAGQIELLDGADWYLKGRRFDADRVIRGWAEKLREALARGYEGLRVNGNAFWVGTRRREAFRAYEHELDRWLRGQRAIVLCTYPLQASRGADIFDAARAHQCSTARRNGAWEVLETPELRRARQRVKKLGGALDLLSKPQAGLQALTPRERLTLAQIVGGASSKEAARRLGISPRTVEFHRANLMRKLGARNTADLVRKVLGE